MSLSSNLLSVTSQQCLYKLKAYSSWFFALIFLQGLALLFSLTGLENMSGGNGILNVSIKYYSADVVITFTFIWIFFITTRLASRLNETIDFTLVTNRISSHLSNIGILLTASLLGGLTSYLMSYVLRTIMYFIDDRSQIGVNGFYPVLSDVLFGIVINALYMLLIAATCYLFVNFTKIHVVFAIFFPAVLLGLAKVNPQFLKTMFVFFASETSPFVFVIKVIFTVLIFFSLSCLISNRTEVRK